MSSRLRRARTVAIAAMVASAIELHGCVVEVPYLMFYSPSMESQEVSVRVNLIPAAIPWPSELDETRCRGLDWRTFRVETDSGDWKAFWDNRRFEIEMRFGFTDSSRQLPAKSFLSLRSFAIAWVDLETGRPIMSCGCYEV